MTFGGPDGLDGGAILDECGNFGVSGYSTGTVAVFDDLTYNPPIPVELQSFSVE